MVPRGAAPGARLPGGVPISPEKWGERGGGKPLDPLLYGPLVPTRSFRRLCHIVPVVGLLRYPSAYPDLERFFRVRLHSKDLGGGRFPIGYPAPFRPTDSPGRAHPAGPGGSPKKTLRAPPTFPSNAPRPVGHASQSFPARRRGKKMESCFDRLRRPKHTSQPPVCLQGAPAAIPQFWEGPHTKQNT